MDVAHAVLIEIAEGKGLQVIESRRPEIPVHGDLRGHGAAAGNVVHHRGEQDRGHIKRDIPGQGIQGVPGDKVVQGIALQQRQHQIHARAAQTADNHDQKGFPVFPDIGNEPGNAKEGQGRLLFFFFHIHGCFHQAVSSSLLMLWI